MTRFLVGATLTRPPSRAYASSLPFAELLPQAPLPRAATLRRWRADLPAGFQLSLVAPRACLLGERGLLHLDTQLERQVSWLAEACEALAADSLVISTGSEISTDARDRQRLAAFADRVRNLGAELVWAPQGLWTPELAQPFAQDIGAQYAADPRESFATEEACSYWRVALPGPKARGLNAIADRLTQMSARSDRVRLAIQAEKAVEQAKRLQRSLSGE